MIERLLKGAVLCALAFPAQAQNSDTGFTFKRVGPPTTSTKRLISIQVEPQKQPERVLDHVVVLDPEDDPINLPANAQHVADGPGWFWSVISPKIEDAGFSRLAQAAAVLVGTPEEHKRIKPNPARIQGIISEYGAQILKATAGTSVSPALVVAVISTESGGNKDAKSPAGAMGLMQLMPPTASRFGVTKILDVDQNIGGGVKYLEFLLDRFGGDAVLALAAYNAGEGAVDRAGGVPNYNETRAYVPKVVAAWDQARLQCLIPPSKATDGCLFTGLRVAGQ